MKKTTRVLLACCLCLTLLAPSFASAGFFQTQLTFGQEPYEQNIAFLICEKDEAIILRSALFPRKDIRITDDKLLLTDISTLVGWLGGKTALTLPGSVGMIREVRMNSFRTGNSMGDFQGDTYIDGKTKEGFRFTVGEFSAVLELMGKVTAGETDPDVAAFSRWMNRLVMLLSGMDPALTVTLSLIDGGESVDVALSDENGTYLTASLAFEGSERAAAVFGYGLSGKTWYTAVDYVASPEETELSWGTYLDEDQTGWIASRRMSEVAEGTLSFEKNGDVTTVTDSFTAGNIPDLLTLEGELRAENGFVTEGTAALMGMDEKFFSWSVRMNGTDQVGYIQPLEQTEMTWKEAFRTIREGIPLVLIWISPFMPVDLLTNMINAIP